MKCFLGFDGGGSKTECVVMTENGEIAGRATGPASNPTRIGFPAALAGVSGAADAAIRSTGCPVEVVALCAGLAGTGREENRVRMKQLLQSEFPSALIDVRIDLELPLAAMPPGPAIVLVVGTGSAAIGRDAAGVVRRQGGLGPAGSDEGSAFDIGHAAVSAARSEDSSAADELARQILRHLGATSWSEVDSRLLANADSVYPRVFPVVAAAADSGNTLAQALLQAAAKKLASMVRDLAAMLKLSEQEFPLGKAGGTIGRSRCFDEALDRELHRILTNVKVIAPNVDSAATAAKIALQLYQSQKASQP